MANHSIVLNSSTFLPGGGELDSQVQITVTDNGTAFISVSVPNQPNVYVRIEAVEWDRYQLSQ